MRPILHLRTEHRKGSQEPMGNSELSVPRLPCTLQLLGLWEERGPRKAQYHLISMGNWAREGTGTLPTFSCPRPPSVPCGTSSTSLKASQEQGPYDSFLISDAHLMSVEWTRMEWAGRDRVK